MSTEDPYVYPNTDVLRNKFNVQDATALATREQLISHRALVDMQRSPVTGSFDLGHYQDTHRRLFEQVYEWAGQPRTVDLWKSEIALRGQSVAYSPPASIETDAKAALTDLQNAKFTDLTRRPEAVRFASYVAELWRAHPFREGNTRTLFAFVEQYTRQRGLALDQAIINRVPSETRDALALATTGQVSPLANLIMEARRSELQRAHPELGRLTSEAVEIVRLMGNPRIVQPEIGDEIRGQVVTTSYSHVLVQDSRRLSAVPLHSFAEPPQNNQRVAVRVLGPDELPSRNVLMTREQAARKELNATVLIPAVVVPIAGQSYDDQRRNRIEIPAPSEALRIALASNKPQEILSNTTLMDEARTIQGALTDRFGRPGAALLAEGNASAATKLLPQGQDLEQLRTVLKPIQDVVVAEKIEALTQSRKNDLSKDGPSLGHGR